MTTYHTARETDGVPAPSKFDSVHLPRSAATFKPFVAVRHDRLLTIIGVTSKGLFRDTRGYLHFEHNLERDLDAYAERMRNEYQDQNDTHDDCQW